MKIVARALLVLHCALLCHLLFLAFSTALTTTLVFIFSCKWILQRTRRVGRFASISRVFQSQVWKFCDVTFDVNGYCATVVFRHWPYLANECGLDGSQNPFPKQPFDF